MYTKIIMFIVFLTLLSIPNNAEAQKSEMDSIIKQFFIENGEINAQNKLDISAKNIISENEYKDDDPGIFLIRTIYSTEGKDYLFFSNKNHHEILSFDDLKKIVETTAKFFEGKTDQLFLKNLESVLSLYHKNNIYVNKKTDRYKIKLKN